MNNMRTDISLRVIFVLLLAESITNGETTDNKVEERKVLTYVRKTNCIYYN